MHHAKNVVRQLGGDKAVKDFDNFKLLCFNDPDVVPWFDRAATKFAGTQLNGYERVKMAPITERRHL